MRDEHSLEFPTTFGIQTENYFCAMWQKVRHLLQYLHYRFTAQSRHDVHSPFIFDLVTKVINNKTQFSEFNKIENLRRELLNDNKVINVTDFGTAFGGPKTYRRKISEIAKHSAKPAKYAQLLFRIINHYKPGAILELGTSFGISTMYMVAANPQSKIITVEGCPETSRIAKINFQKSGFKNIQPETGSFDHALDKVLTGFEKLDLVFFDGNHQKDATLNYFQKCLLKSHNKSIFIFDDINWSREMQDAWNKIKNHPQVTVTVDLFVMGIVFFNTDLTRQHFTIRF
ncbi:MAG: O-methyltransferase [Bacteroidia bacterium]